MKKLTISLAILFCSFLTSLHAQMEYYRAGYVITNSQDTLRGFIPLQPDQELCQSVKLATSIEGNSPQIFDPTTALGFSAERGRDFVRKEIVLHREGKVDTLLVFLRILVEGYESLYVYRESPSDRTFFLQKQGESFVKLEQNRKWAQNQPLGVNQVEYKDVYKSHLKLFLGDCPELKKKIEVTPFKEKGLSKLISQYNTCRGDANSKNLFKATPPLKKIGLMVGKGASLTSRNSKGLFLGLYYERNFLQKAKWLGIQFDLSYFGDDYTWNSGNTTFRERPATILFQVTGNFYLTQSKIRPFFSVGIGPGLYVSHTEKNDGSETTNSSHTQIRWASLKLAGGLDFYLNKKNFIRAQAGIQNVFYQISIGYGIVHW